MGKKSTKGAAPAAENTALVARPTSELADWEQEMLAEAQQAKEALAGVGGGNAVSIRGGKLKIAGELVPSGEIAIVMLCKDAASLRQVKAYYADPNFDQDNPQSPACFAFGNDIATMAPHADSTERQCDKCSACRWNEFGTAVTGSKKGKRCKDLLRLAFIEGGTLEGGKFKAHDAAKLAASEIYTLNVPATSMKTLKKYVESVVDCAQRPPYGMFTKLKVEPDDKTQVRITFEPLGKTGREETAVIRSRVDSGAALVNVPFPKPSTEGAAETPKPAGKKGKGKDKLA